MDITSVCCTQINAERMSNVSCNIANIFSQHIRFSYAFAVGTEISKALSSMDYNVVINHRLPAGILLQPDMPAHKTNRIESSPKYTQLVPVGGGNKTYFISAICWKVFLCPLSTALNEWFCNRQLLRYLCLLCILPSLSHISEFCFDVTHTECS